MAYTQRNAKESDGHWELVDDRALSAMRSHLKKEMEVVRRRHDHLRTQYAHIMKEINRRKGEKDG